jgi:hypothetical protein
VRTEALGEKVAHKEPVDMYRLDLSNYKKGLTFPS